jgi:hypothetical protein
MEEQDYGVTLNYDSPFELDSIFEQLLSLQNLPDNLKKSLYFI